jgi:tetratricopeptide (TPR) repeat protein
VSLADFSLISGLIVAYFVQNLAVFDSFVTYLSLMVLLGYIYFLSGERLALVEVQAEPLATKQFLAVLGCGLFILFSVYNYNYLPYRMLDYTIQGQVYLSQGQIDKAVEAYKKGLAYHTGLDRDSRTSLIRWFVSHPSALNKMPADKAQNIAEYIIELAEKNVEYNPHDSLNLMLLAQAYNIAASLNRNNAEKFSYYSNLAEETINRSIAATPGRVPVYFSKAQIYLTRGDIDKAIETMKYAISLEDDFSTGHCQLARLYWRLSQREEKYKDLKPEAIKEVGRCLDTGGVGEMSDDLRKEFLKYYWDNKDYEHALKIARFLARKNSKNADAWVNLAKIYEKLGDFDKAREAAQKAVEANPAYQAAAQSFIEGLGK